MQRPRSIKITDLNPHLMCVLCGGYYIDATTIIECLHSFCKSCLVRYLESNKYCPICDVQVHKTNPLLNIRQDQTLQNIVYKLVPGLYQNELKSRREFYKLHPDRKPVNSEDAGELTENSHLFLPDESISLSLEYDNPAIPQEAIGRRYLLCPAAVTVYHLKKLVRAKFGLNDDYKIELMYDEEYLPEHLSLVDIGYIYQWKRKSPIHLKYHILEYRRKKIKLFHESDNASHEHPMKSSLNVEDNSMQVCEPIKDDEVMLQDQTISKPDESIKKNEASNEWKEVQLQISENGVMSVTDVQSVPTYENVSPSTENTAPTNGEPDNDKEKIVVPPTNLSCDSIKKTKCQVVNLRMEKLNSIEPNKQENVKKSKGNASVECSDNTNVDQVKPSLQNTTKLESLNHKNVNENISVKPPPTVNKSESVIARPSGYQKVYPGIKPQNTQIYSKDTIIKKNSNQGLVMNQKLNTSESNATTSVKKELNQPIRYKTLKSPTKHWNPSLPRSATPAGKHSQDSNNAKETGSKTNDEAQSSAKPPRFFKMRNMPRFLGNPASGVKPMYQVVPGSELGSNSPNTTAPRSPKQGNTSITLMKIDPKTLSPIAMSPATPQSINSTTTNSPQPVQNKKLPPPFVPGSPKHHMNNFQNSVKKKTHSPRIPSPAHNYLLQSNPFLSSVPHSTNHLFGGFPRTFPPPDPNGNNPLLSGTNSQLIRAMSALCPPSAAFHPSLPPSISMLFNPHHAHHRLNQVERSNFKSMSNESKKTPTPPPTIQRIPPSGPNSKTSLENCQNSNALMNKTSDLTLHKTNSATNVSQSQSTMSQNTKLKSSSSSHEQKSHCIESVLNSPPNTSKKIDSESQHNPKSTKDAGFNLNGPHSGNQKSVSIHRESVNSASIQVQKNIDDKVCSLKESPIGEVKVLVNSEHKEISVTSSVTINNNSENSKNTTHIKLNTELNRTDTAPNKS